METVAETTEIIVEAQLASTKPEDEAGSGRSVADYRDDPEPLAAVKKRVRETLSAFAVANGIKFEFDNSGAEDVVIAEAPNSATPFSPILGFATLPPDAQMRLMNTEVLYGITLRIDSDVDNRLIAILARVEFESSRGAATVSKADADMLAQVLADAVQSSFDPVGS